MDGAAGLPLPEHNGRTCLELAETPHLDLLVSTGILGMAKTIPTGMEPSSSNGCMSVLGYDPKYSIIDIIDEAVAFRQSGSLRPDVKYPG